jgi:hypothetical protein
MANLLKALEGLRTAPNAIAPSLAAAKHWDYILQSHDYNAHSGAFSNGYLRLANWRHKPGDADYNVLRATMGALLEKLFADGALHAYQIDEEVVHSADPGGFFVGIVTNGPEGVVKLNAAVDDLQKNNPTGTAAITTVLDQAGHRDFFA